MNSSAAIPHVARVFLVAFVVGFLPFLGCSDDAPGDRWQLVTEGQPAALLSVWGTSGSDLWTVGGDSRDGAGPLVLHYDGESWDRIQTGEAQGNLWWVHGFPQGPVFMSGDGGVILRYENGTFTKMQTPGTGTVFGVWGASPDAMWAVGSVTPSSGAFAWRLEGETWIDEPSLPADVIATSALWKVNGRAADDVYLVGSDGVSLHWDGSALSQIDTGSSTSLFTVHCSGERVVAVGGLASGVIVEYEGTSWNNTTPENAPALTGVVIQPDNSGLAVGQFGAVYERTAGSWHQADLGFRVDQNLHATWIDPDGGIWAVGGQTFAAPLTDGLIVHHGSPINTDGL